MHRRIGGIVQIVVGAVIFAMGTTAFAQTSGSVTLAPGFMPDPQRLSGVSGGTVQASSLNPSCRGWIAPQASHMVNVAGGLAFLRVFVESTSDTTLVIRAPNGQFLCNDDTFGLNPDVDAAYGPGQYLIWVGSYSQGTSGPYTITFSELRTTMPSGASTGGTTEVPSGGGVGVTTPVVGRSRITGNTNVGGSVFDYHTTSSTVTFTQACQVASVELNVRGRHTFPSDLTVRLRSPSGNTETLQTHVQRSPFRHWSTSHFTGEQAAGAWVLSIEDSVGGDSGALNGFNITLSCI